MRKVYDRKVLLIGAILGLIGGGLMVWLIKTDFGLGYISGYLPLINYVFIMAIGLTIYRTIEKENSTYLKRMGFGFFIFIVNTVIYISYKSIFDTWAGKENTFLENSGLIITTISIGLLFSSLLALGFKPNYKLDKNK